MSSPVARVNACLERISRLNPVLNAFITVTAVDARTAAANAASAIDRGRLHGMPVAIKDFYDTAGIRTTAGSEHFAQRIPAHDAEVVTRLKQAGAIVVGKTNMDALGMATTGLTSFFGPVKNPWNADYIAGGSSCGSAVAVATAMCDATVDTDAIGSCRLPAACCGVVGFKGTYGLISTRGILADQPPPDEMIVWFSHAAVTARRVADAASVVDALKAPGVLADGIELADGLKQTRSLSIGVPKDTAQPFAAAVDLIAGFGHVIRKVRMPPREPGNDLRHIERDRKAASRELFGDIDLFVLPTLESTVPRLKAGGATLSPRHTAFANYYGLPALSVPCGFDANGLPVGLQIVGKPAADLDVLTLGHQYEAAAGWFERRPPV